MCYFVYCKVFYCIVYCSATATGYIPTCSVNRPTQHCNLYSLRKVMLSPTQQNAVAHSQEFRMLQKLPNIIITHLTEAICL